MNEHIINEDQGNLYRPRVVDDRIDELLSSFGGVHITGPKWCGKTWTGKHHSNSSVFISDIEVKKKAELDPKNVLEGSYPRLIDEWQDVPELWDIARLNIDFSSTRGMYIFTGSSMPPKNSTSHTGTGRFAKVSMRPMSLYESGDSTGSISLSGLFKNEPVPAQSSEMDYPKIVHLICKGGWPSALTQNTDYLPRQYIDSLVDSYTTYGGNRRRSKTAMELILKSLARNTATSVKASAIATDISEGGKPVSENTVRTYIDMLKNNFVIDEQEAWFPHLRSRGRIRATPKKHFIDPSLAVAALDADEETIMDDPNTAGFLFESLCYRDVSVYSSAIGGKVKYFGDSNSFEIDQIVEGGKGKWGAIEVKLGRRDFDKAAKNLLKMKDKIDDRVKPPSFLMILTATGGLAYTRDDGVAVVPIDCLGP
jgi:predicted AAA+ superfamily ATPase